MSVNSDFFGTLDADDRDWIVVELSMSEQWRIKLLGADSGMGTLTDPRLRSMIQQAMSSASMMTARPA